MLNGLLHLGVLDKQELKLFSLRSIPMSLNRVTSSLGQALCISLIIPIELLASASK